MDRNLWETSRLQAYIIAQCNSTKKITQQDICTFKWEDNNNVLKSPSDIEIATEDINRLKELSNQFNESVVWEEIE